MNKRVVTKIGDIFAVDLGNDFIKYFQLIAFDPTQLNSDVIRSFERQYPIATQPDPDEIAKGEVEFYAHCVTKWGVKQGYWEKYGKSKDIGELGHILFKGTSDYGHKAGEEPVRISHNWYVWHMGDQDVTRVGELKGDNRKAEIGLIINPKSIAQRIRTGEYDLPNYPGFE